MTRCKKSSRFLICYKNLFLSFSLPEHSLSCLHHPCILGSRLVVIRCKSGCVVSLSQLCLHPWATHARGLAMHLLVCACGVPSPALIRRSCSTCLRLLSAHAQQDSHPPPTMHSAVFHVTPDYHNVLQFCSSALLILLQMGFGGSRS